MRGHDHLETVVKSARQLIRVLALATVAGTAYFPTSARAQDADEAPGRRIALVFGNSSYETAPLRNPANDARDIAASLSRVDFVVSGPVLDTPLQRFADTIKGFVATIQRGDTVFVYFAGHGLQIGGRIT